jgi:hypothetical protein
MVEYKEKAKEQNSKKQKKYQGNISRAGRP